MNPIPERESSVPIPWWTSVAALVLIHLGTEISLVFKYDQGVADYYLPTAISVILINWWGPSRVLPVIYLNAVVSTFLWGIPADRWMNWIAYGRSEFNARVIRRTFRQGAVAVGEDH